jgi:hypothetical protein
MPGRWWSGSGTRLKLYTSFLAEEGAADIPRHALGADRVADAVAVEDLQRALGVANAARTDRYGVVLVQQQHRDALQVEVERHARPTGPAPTMTTGGLQRLAAAISGGTRYSYFG